LLPKAGKKYDIKTNIAIIFGIKLCKLFFTVINNITVFVTVFVEIGSKILKKESL
jgi:hypothetical protein